MICRECSTDITGIRDRWIHGKVLEEKQLCFDCDFWLDLINRKDAIRVDGIHYLDAGNQPNPILSQMLGFGGRKWHIRFHDGREVTTNNLWHQGNIPARFRDRMPDNAEIKQLRYQGLDYITKDTK